MHSEMWTTALAQLKHEDGKIDIEAIAERRGTTVRKAKEAMLRLKDRIYDYVISDMGLLNCDLSDLHTGKTHAYKRFCQAFANYDHLEDRKELLERAERLCVSNQQFHILAEIQSYYAESQGMFDVDRLDEIGRYADKCLSAFQAEIRSRIEKTRYFAHLIRRKGSGTSYDVDFAIESIEKLKRYAKKGGDWPKYYLWKVQSDYFARIGEYVKSENKGHDLIEWLPESCINKPQLLSAVYDDMADNALLCRKFEKSQMFIDRAFAAVPMKGINHVTTCFTGFHTAFYLADVELANKWLLRIDRLALKGFPFEEHMLNYFRAWVHHLKGNFNDCRLLLQKKVTRLKEDDKNGYNLGVRLLWIKNDIELCNLDQAEKRIDAYRKHIKALEGDSLVHPRDKRIYNALTAWKRAGFTGSPEFDLPEWEPKRHELIPIEKWGSEVFMVA